MKLFTVANAKTKKGEALGWLTIILHLKPNIKVCPYSTPGCRSVCLNTAGRGKFAMVQCARQKRNDLLENDPEAFIQQVKEEIKYYDRRAKKKGLKLAVRLNGTSDLMWDDVIKSMPDIQFYDYTKNLKPRDIPNNYDLTFSLSETNKSKEAAKKFLSNGTKVAIVFRNHLPKEWNGYPVLDGDKNDLRFLMPKGIVVGLKAKGKAKKDKSGFVQD